MCARLTQPALPSLRKTMNKHVEKEAMFIHYFLCYNGTVNKYPKGEPNCGKQFIFIHYFLCYNSTVKKHQAADAHLHPLLFHTLF